MKKQTGSAVTFHPERDPGELSRPYVHADVAACLFVFFLSSPLQGDDITLSCCSLPLDNMMQVQLHNVFF